MSEIPALRVTAEHEADADFDLLPVATHLLRRRRFILACMSAAVGLGLAHAFLTPYRFTATTTFVVAESQTSGRASGLGALALRYGIGLSSLAPSATPRLFQAAVTSREVLNSVLDTTLEVPLDSGRPVRRLPLLDWYEVDEGPRPARLEDGRRALLKHMDVTVDDRTGILTLKVSDQDPHVAAAIAHALVEGLNRFNLQTRQSTSRATRVFLEQRESEAADRLREAENALRAFLQANRATGSAALQLEQARLQRQIDLHQDTYRELTQELEQARSDEVRDTPVLTVIEDAIPPVRRSWPKRKLILLAWTAAGLMVCLMWIAIGSWIRQSEANATPAWLEFKQEFTRVTRRRRRDRTSSREGGPA